MKSGKKGVTASAPRGSWRVIFTNWASGPLPRRPLLSCSAASRWQTVCLGLSEPARRVLPRTDNPRHVLPHTQAHTFSHHSPVPGPCPATPRRAHQGPRYSQSQRQAAPTEPKARGQMAHLLVPGSPQHPFLSQHLHGQGLNPPHPRCQMGTPRLKEAKSCVPQIVCGKVWGNPGALNQYISPGEPAGQGKSRGEKFHGE